MTFEALKYLGITKSTLYSEAKQKLKDYYAIIEKKELVKTIYLRQQEKYNSIQFFARNVKLILNKACPDGNLDMLEKKIFIKVLQMDFATKS